MESPPTDRAYRSPWRRFRRRSPELFCALHWLVIAPVAVFVASHYGCAALWIARPQGPPSAIELCRRIWLTGNVVVCLLLAFILLTFRRRGGAVPREAAGWIPSTSAAALMAGATVGASAALAA